MIKIIKILISQWHTEVWTPFIVKLCTFYLGRKIVHIISLFFGTLVILNILAPATGEMPCLIHIFIRSKYSPYRGMKFKKRIRILLKFWRS
jgi:hypothetical protein